MTFPRAQNATFTDPMGSTAKFHSAQMHTAPHVDNVTASGDADIILLNGLSVYSVSALAAINSSGFGKSQSSTLTLGTVLIKPYDWTVGKRWRLDDATGSGDSSKVWNYGWPTIYGTIRGWVKASGPLYQTQSMTFSAVFDVFGTVAGTAKIRRLIVGEPIRTGGNLPVTIQWQSTGQVTHSSGITPLFDTDTTVAPASGTLAMALDSGETVSANAVVENVTVRAVAQIGGEIVMAANFRLGAAA